MTARAQRPATRQTVTCERLTGERALFGAQRLDVIDSVFTDGESPLKQCRDVTITGSLFGWKYPLWYADHVSVTDSTLLNTARAGIWYSRDISITNTTIDAPKTFRRSRRISLEKVQLPRAEETLWQCERVRLDHVTAQGAYFAMGSSDITARDLRLTGDYAFDGVRNVEITDATILSKDAFWNSENVTVRDSFIVGEYLGWNSRN
ncbi:MAG TPA: DUF3737 family protein, partial [Propionibacteriaceae bacterium]|nr:DUF3737 family protein [Propionibacteriaceae bacterium]